MRMPAPALMLLLLLVPAARAEAAPIVFTFTVDLLIGPLAGQTFDGTFSVEGDDCPGGVCDGTFDPNGPNDLLSFAITIDGSAFDITDDASYPDQPQVTFDAGNVVGFHFYNGAALPFLSIRLEGAGSQVVYHPSLTGDTTVGEIGGFAQAVPEPATMLMLGVGLSALGARRRRQCRNS